MGKRFVRAPDKLVESIVDKLVQRRFRLRRFKLRSRIGDQTLGFNLMILSLFIQVRPRSKGTEF